MPNEEMFGALVQLTSLKINGGGRKRLADINVLRGIGAHMYTYWKLQQLSDCSSVFLIGSNAWIPGVKHPVGVHAPRERL